MIYIECYADELLIEILGISSKNIEHSHGKGNVCKKLKSKRNSVGMVDADPQILSTPVASKTPRMI